MKYYRVVGRFRGQALKICFRNDKVSFEDADAPPTVFPGMPNKIPAERRNVHDGIFSSYEIALCVLGVASSNLKVVDLKIEEVSNE